MKIFLRIIGLILLAQLLSVLFLFIFNGFELDLKSATDELSLDLVNKLGIDAYVLLSQIFSVLLPAVIFIIIFHFKSLKVWVKIKLPADLTFFYMV